jgi:Domain of unknown function (DUF4440)/Domain of unknown function (DUF3471)
VILLWVIDARKRRIGSVVCATILHAGRLTLHYFRMRLPLVLTLIIWQSTLFTFTTAPDPPIAEAELVRRTQELYDSIASGNREPWKKYFADDCTFSDEKGRTFDKTKLVADITPLPKGYSGIIKIENVISRIVGEMAVLSYDANETEIIFGQELHARYHVTDTWLQRNGKWQILASQAHRYYEDPALGKADETKFPDYVGAYELAPGQTRTVTAEPGRLFVERNGKKEELLPESSDLFFRKGVEGRILFRHNNAGAVDALIDRRNNEDVVWKKTK